MTPPFNLSWRYDRDVRCTAWVTEYLTIGSRDFRRVAFLGEHDWPKGPTGRGSRRCEQPADLALVGPRSGVRAAACLEHRTDLIRHTIARIPRNQSDRAELRHRDGTRVDLEGERALFGLAGGLR